MPRYGGRRRYGLQELAGVLYNDAIKRGKIKNFKSKAGDRTYLDNIQCRLIVEGGSKRWLRCAFSRWSVSRLRSGSGSGSGSGLRRRSGSECKEGGG